MDIQKAYALLGLREGAGEEEIKAAYRVLAQKYDPQGHLEGPLRADAERKMDELNEAFDSLMSYLRTGSATHHAQTNTHSNQSQQSTPQYQAIRKRINAGDIDGALAQLAGIINGDSIAEWNFLMGSAYYYKGWLAQAMGYFQRACQLDPSNAEYQAALRNLQSGAAGAMPGSPYGNTAYPTQAIPCTCCDICTAALCMDMCCSCRSC